MNSYGFIAVGVGAALGAWLRWWLNILLNPISTTIPLGTLAANLIGGYFVGLAFAYFDHHHNVSPEARLFIITGIMGGLTTFSTFSNEVVNLIRNTQYLWAVGAVSLHLFGSLIMTALGMMTFNLLTKV